MKVTLGLATLADLDGGKTTRAFDKAVERLVKDCIDRPGDERPRLANLRARVVPMVEENGVCERCHLEFEITDSVPTRRSRTFEVEVRPSGKMIINPESPDDVRQGTLDEAAPKKD